MANLSENDGNDNNYLYNNKEFENDHNLSFYHYGERYYYPQICRWLQVDPADEFYSAYVYCGNNPVNFVDPDGKETVFIPIETAQHILATVKPEETDFLYSLNRSNFYIKDNFVKFVTMAATLANLFDEQSLFAGMERMSDTEFEKYLNASRMLVKYGTDNMSHEISDLVQMSNQVTYHIQGSLALSCQDDLDVLFISSSRMETPRLDLLSLFHNYILKDQVYIVFPEDFNDNLDNN